MENNIIFQITEDDLQNEALIRIGRKLTEDEIDLSTKLIEDGIGGNALDITYHTIFTEFIDNENT